MSSEFPHFKAGMAMPNSASSWNALVDAARGNRKTPLNAGLAVGKGGKNDPATILVYNDSGSDVAQFGVLGMGDVRIAHADNEEEFRTRIYMTGEEPAADTHEGKFAIALEPIRYQEIGRAAVTGYVQCQVNVRNQYHDRADIKDTDLTQLDSGHVGAAKIVWVAGTTGTQWAIVDLNHAKPTTGFWAKITGNAANGTNKWKYAWTEQERSSTGWSDLTGGRSGTTTTDFALNATEANNDGTGIQGNSIDIDGAVFTDNSDLEIQAVQGDPVVWMRADFDITAGNLAYSFEYVNAVDGECG